jgi:hypothetical protein
MRPCFPLRHFAACIALLSIAAAVQPASAIELDNQSNLVRDDFGVDNDEGTAKWQTPTAWNAIPKYAADPTNDGTGQGNNWYFTQVAHNSEFIFVRYSNAAAFAGDLQLMYLDVDSNRDTGLRGFSGNLAIGAEYYVSGASVTKEGVGGVGWVTWDNKTSTDGSWDIMYKLPRSFMPEVTGFDFVNQAHDSGDDWYPDAGNNASGDWFRYETDAPHTTTAFGRNWTIVEPLHRDNPAVQSETIGMPTTLTFNGVYQTSMDHAAVTPLSPVVGTKVSYDLAVTHEPRDLDDDGETGTWVAEALGAFTSSATDPSDHLLVSTRVGARPFDGPPTHIIHEDPGVDEPEETKVSLAGNPLSDGVQIEWLFTTETTIEISVFSKDGSTLLGPKYTDTISSINDIEGFRLNLFDSEQTMTISDFSVEVVDISLDGDFNDDGFVDSDDLNDPVLGWKARYGVDLDGNDFLAWQRNLGAGTPTTATAGAVPEPSMSLLALLGILGGMPFMRRGGK